MKIRHLKFETNTHSVCSKYYISVLDCLMNCHNNWSIHCWQIWFV